MDQKTYVDVVLKAINTTVSALNDKISVKLILSLDRKRSVSSAEETVKLAESYYTSSESVVGLDLSGDPTVRFYLINFLFVVSHQCKSIVFCSGKLVIPFPAAAKKKSLPA